MAGSWSTPADIHRILHRHWQAGDLLVRAPTLFPLRIPLRGPAPAAIGRQLPAVRGWIQALEDGAQTAAGRGYVIETAPTSSRQLGTNTIPGAVLVPAVEDALALLGLESDWNRWQALRAITATRCPGLLPWLEREPLLPLAHAPVWEQALRVVAWMEANPRCGRYVRSLDIPGCDTKFIETQEALLRVLLDAALPAAAITAGERGFAGRYGLRPRTVLIQVRILDPALMIDGMDHFAASLEQLSRLSLRPALVLVTENEINGLILPSISGAVAIFGRGYAVDVLPGIPWVRRARLVYWGDIDTHGFAILDRLRAGRPDATSMLMDEATLLTHRQQWVEEPEPVRTDLPRLTAEERMVHEGLARNRWGHQLRLEQERIRLDWMQERLARIIRDAAAGSAAMSAPS